MRFIDTAHHPALPVAWVTKVETRELALGAMTSDIERAVYITKNAIWSSLKTWLVGFGGEKCWYCETAIGRAPLEVDHFRPKLAVTVLGVRLAKHSGYWWLAYDWHNYRLSCQRCNRPSNDPSGILRGKANEFPVRDEFFRGFTNTDLIASEEPTLLDPCCEADPALLLHALNGEIYPAAEQGTWAYERADYTIEQLWLNDPTMTENKRDYWLKLDLLILHAPRERVLPLIQSGLNPDREYSAFVREAVSSHREKNWINELL